MTARRNGVLGLYILLDVTRPRVPAGPGQFPGKFQLPARPSYLSNTIQHTSGSRNVPSSHSLRPACTTGGQRRRGSTWPFLAGSDPLRSREKKWKWRAGVAGSGCWGSPPRTQNCSSATDRPTWSHFVSAMQPTPPAFSDAWGEGHAGGSGQHASRGCGTSRPALMKLEGGRLRPSVLRRLNSDFTKGESPQPPAEVHPPGRPSRCVNSVILAAGLRRALGQMRRCGIAIVGVPPLLWRAARLLQRAPIARR